MNFVPFIDVIFMLLMFFFVAATIRPTEANYRTNLPGGRDKGNDYSRLVEVVEQHVKAIIAMGESADKVVKEFTSHTHVVKSSSMDEALRKAGELARSGDIVLLSPACASFDWFQNYEHRGRAFKEFVNAL